MYEVYMDHSESIFSRLRLFGPTPKFRLLELFVLKGQILLDYLYF